MRSFGRCRYQIFELPQPMKLSDLWIGDRLFSNTLKEIVLYDGKSDEGLVRVLHRGIKQHLPVEDLSPAGDEEAFINTFQGEEQTIFHPRKSQVPATIDLHYEKGRRASDATGPVVNILQHQLERCRAFVDAAVQHHLTRIVIIHGKGDQGILRNAVRSLLREYPAVKGQQPSPDEGALEVTLAYTDQIKNA